MAHSNVVVIEGTSVHIVEYRYQPVISFSMMDNVHLRVDGTAKRNFQANKARLILNEDYYELTGDEIRTQSLRGLFPARTAKGILLTETGYLMLVKSFTDELAWKVQRQLVNGYFRKTQKQEVAPLTEKTIGGIVKRGVRKQLETVVAGLAVLTEQMNEMKKELRKPHKSLSHGGEHRLENAAKSAVAALTAIQLDSIKQDWAIEAVELLHQSEMLHELAMERLDNACIYMRIEDRNNAPFLYFGDIVGYRKIDGFVYDGFYVLELLGKKVVYQCQHVGNGHIRLIAGSTAQVITLTEFEQHVRGIIVMRCNIMNEKALLGAPIRKSTYSPGPQQTLAV